MGTTPRKTFFIVLHCDVDIVWHFTVRTISDEDDILPMQEITYNSDANGQPNGMYVDTELPNYLISIPKKEEVTDFFHDMSEHKKETGLGYDSNGDANKVVDFDTEVNLVQFFQLASIIDQDTNENMEVDNSVVKFTRFSGRIGILKAFRFTLFLKH